MTDPHSDPHWYVMSRIGLLTLCADEADARESAGRFDKEWPDAAPHRAVQLVAAEDMDAMLAERDRLREAVQETVRVIESNPSSITDTVWVTGNKPETLLDRCRAALAQETDDAA